MISRHLRVLAIVGCLVSVMRPSDFAADLRAEDSPAIDGLWSGSWGGGQIDGVIFQPVMAELFVQKNHVELFGFREVGRVTGTIRFDAMRKRIQITPDIDAGGRPAPKAIEFEYQIKADRLTLTGNDRTSITLQRCPVEEKPMANVGIELLVANGINEKGDLLVTEFKALRAGRTNALFFEPLQRSLKTKHSEFF